MIFTLNDPWFDYVKNGNKIYEGRRYIYKLSLLTPGDIILFKHHINNNIKPFYKKIKQIYLFTTCEEALKHLPINEILPGIKTIEEGVKIYLKYVSLETQLKDGNTIRILLIHFYQDLNRSLILGP